MIVTNNKILGWVAVQNIEHFYPYQVPGLTRIRHHSLPWLEPDACNHTESVCTQLSCVKAWMDKGWRFSWDINKHSRDFHDALAEVINEAVREDLQYAKTA